MIYLLSYYEYPLNMTGKGEEHIKGYTESKSEAEDYTNKDGEGWGKYKATPIKKIKAN
jgi:hypothetical protein